MHSPYVLVFRGTPNLVCSCPSFHPLSAFESLYSALGAKNGQPGVQERIYYISRMGDFQNMGIYKTKIKQKQNDAGLNIMENPPFYFDTTGLC